ncbi:MAG: AMP-binding protein [Bacteroidota bacterium]
MPAEITTLRDVLHGSSKLHPDRPALSMVDGRPLTYAALFDQVNSLSHFLQEKGIVKGDRVALLGENMPNWGMAYFAITSMGAVAVPLLIDFHPNQIGHILRHAGCKAIFVSAKLSVKLDEVEIRDVHTTILLDDLTVVPPRTKQDTIARLLEQGSREFARLRGAALRASRRTPSPVKPDDLAAIVYTSGTTGHSKGVMLTHGNLVSDAQATANLVDVSHEDRMLSILPLPHAYECTIGLITPVLIGASVYYLDRPPTQPVLLPALQKVKPTVLLVVPLVVEKIYKSKIHPRLTKNALLRSMQRVRAIRKKLSRMAGEKLRASFGGELRILPIAGASLAPDVEQFLHEAGFPYTIGYGLTETSPLIASTPPEKTRLHSTGPAIPGTEIRIDNPDQETGEGEILVKGPTVMKGYYKDPERTNEVLSHDGWFRTGDLGVLDDDNYLYIKGRLKNMILGSNGRNIYPEELEAIINELDIVLESLVLEENGTLVARIHPDYEKLDRILSSSSANESQVREKLRSLMDNLHRQINDRLPAHSRIGRIIEQVEPFVKTPTQKIKRYLYIA